MSTRPDGPFDALAKYSRLECYWLLSVFSILVFLARILNKRQPFVLSENFDSRNFCRCLVVQSLVGSNVVVK